MRYILYMLHVLGMLMKLLTVYIYIYIYIYGMYFMNYINCIYCLQILCILYVRVYTLHTMYTHILLYTVYTWHILSLSLSECIYTYTYIHIIHTVYWNTYINMYIHNTLFFIHRLSTYYDIYIYI